MYAYPSVKVTRINFRSLLPAGAMEKMNPHRILMRVQREVLKQIQDKLLQSTLSHRAKLALSKGFEVQRRPSSVVVVAKHPAFRPLLLGRKNRQMRWLMKAARPIPIITDEGELIFRNATARSMKNGAWYHPHRESTTVLQKATKAARTIIKARLQKDFQKEFRKALGKGAR